MRKHIKGNHGNPLTIMAVWHKWLLAWPCIGIALITLYRNIIYINLKGMGTTVIKRPFSMPIEAAKYQIFQPIYDVKDLEPPLFSSVQDFISAFTKRVGWVNTMLTNKPDESDEEYARLMYLEMMKSVVSAMIYGDKEKSVSVDVGRDRQTLGEFQEAHRKGGGDWPYLADTMTGIARLNNVRDLLMDVMKNGVKGGYIETGVWRGGSSIFARAVLAAHGEADNRISYVCDSFHGLPPGDRLLDPNDKNWDNTPYLEVASEIVAGSFSKYGLLDSNVIFVKGFFNESMAPLSKHIDNLSIMRLDGDMYESTVDVLYNLYDKLSIGGYVIMDDWYGFPSRTACEDFFKVHGISPEIVQIDNLAAYWQKTEDIKTQYWRYEQNKFKGDDEKDV